MTFSRFLLFPFNAGERENAADGGRNGANARRAAEERGGADQAEADAAGHADPTAEEGDAGTGIIYHNLLFIGQ